MGRPKKIKIPIQEDNVEPSVPVIETKIQSTLSKEKKEKLLKVMNDINNQYDETMLNFAITEPLKQTIPYGIPELDKFCGNGGVKGNVIIAFGSEGTGKTSLALYQIAETQKAGGIACLIDMEHSFNADRAKIHGVNIDELILIENCTTAEQAMDLVIKLSREKVVDVVVLDCYDKETMILTNEGWKYFEELSGKELVLSLDKNNSTAIYSPIKRIIKHKHNGDMACYDSRRLNFSMTPNNKILFGGKKGQRKYNKSGGWETDTIENIIKTHKNQRFYLKKGFEWEGKEQEYYTINGEIVKSFKNGKIVKIKKSYKILMNDWLELLGWFLSEGSFQKYSNKKVNGISISQSSKVNAEKCEKILELMKRLPFNYNWYSKYNKFSINNAILARELYNTCGDGSKNKRVPDYVRYLPGHQIKKLLDSFLLGDGFLAWNGEYNFRTKSKSLGYGLHELFLKSGCYCSLIEENLPMRKKWIVDHWANFGGKFYYLQTYTSNNYSHYVELKNIKTEKYDDYIYDVEIDSPTHLIYTMRKGTCFWGSNSVQAMSPKAEQEGKKGVERSMEEDEMALLAKKMGKFLRRVAGFIYKGKVALVLIGQVRTEGLGTFITKEGMTGGMALKHWSVQTLYLRKGQGSDSPTEKILNPKTGKKEDIRIGFDMVIKIIKNKKSFSQPEGSDIHLPYLFNNSLNHLKE